jgi:hypothetical protein
MTGPAAGGTQSEWLIAALRRKYVWWAPDENERVPAERIVAQAMDIGVYEDILLLEEAFGTAALSRVLKNAQPGWFSKPSWGFWRDRLDLADALPQAPPTRSPLAADS